MARQGFLKGKTDGPKEKSRFLRQGSVKSGNAGAPTSYDGRAFCGQASYEEGRQDARAGGPAIERCKAKPLLKKQKGKVWTEASSDNA